MVATVVFSTIAYRSFGDRAGREADARKHEREFADLKQRQADGQWHDAAISERAHDGSKDGRLCDDHSRDHDAESRRFDATDTAGSSNMPTDTKNSMPKMSRSGITSLSA